MSELAGEAVERKRKEPGASQGTEAEGKQGKRLRIKHKSLILAQDERWRRA